MMADTKARFALVRGVIKWFLARKGVLICLRN
jgi:hypothetical protein